MGRRARTGGVTGALLREAQKRRAKRDEELARIAQNVYVIGAEVKQTGGVGIPLAVYAPFRAAVELWSLVIARRFNVADAAGVSEDEVRADLADYMTAWLIDMGTSFRVDAFLDWRERIRGLEKEVRDGSSDDDGGGAAAPAVAQSGGEGAASGSRGQA